MNPSLAGIDWQRPWLAQWHETGLPVQCAPDWMAAVNEAAAALKLTNQSGLALRFVSQQRMPPETAYEAFIHESGQVPTRDNLHDFFNALAWLHYPRIKRTLNALQAAEIARRLTSPSTSGSRGRQRDAATLFDENAALFISSDASLVDALRAHDWHEVFERRAQAFGSGYAVELFGHALLEKLVQPYKAITAHAWVLNVDTSWFELGDAARRTELDARVSEQIKSGFTSSDFTPLPVLGVPHWWPNQDAAFYGDTSVFRPRRVKASLA